MQTDDNFATRKAKKFNEQRIELGIGLQKPSILSGYATRKLVALLIIGMCVTCLDKCGYLHVSFDARIVASSVEKFCGICLKSNRILSRQFCL